MGQGRLLQTKYVAYTKLNSASDSDSAQPAVHVAAASYACMYKHTQTVAYIHVRRCCPHAAMPKTKQCIKKCKSKALGAVASASTTGTFRAHSARSPQTNKQRHPWSIQSHSLS